MDNMVYIPVCRGWSVNGAAQWDVVAVPTNKAYKMGDDTVYYNGTMYSGHNLYSTSADAWAWINDRWNDKNSISLDTLPDLYARNKRGA